MVYFLLRIIGQQVTRLILCFSIFSQLLLHPVSTDIYSDFGTGYALVQKANICTVIVIVIVIYCYCYCYKCLFL